ncbi:MAG: hypothetical protein JSR61_21205 [Proteobacteria bacterium]|nr:hypothetical protein [Pseudomonadota bacterium]
MNKLLRLPLLRLLAINLAIGVTAAVVMIGGLMWLNPAHLRDLILADRGGAAAFGLLLFGLIVTFGSVAMGTAIMALGRKPKPPAPGGGKPVAVLVRATAR